MKDPFTYRKELMDKAKLPNEEACDLIFKKIKEGHSISGWGNLSGPYTNCCTYFISDGTMVQVTTPAPLHWVDLTRFE